MRALLVPQGDLWAAQCLDYDIAACGVSITEAKANLLALIADQCWLDVDAGRRTLADISEAPKVFFEAWKTAHRLEPSAEVEWRIADKVVDLSGCVGGVAVKP